MLKKNKLYYIESIKAGGKEISEENPIFIKGETWQWGNIKAGRGKQKEMTYETDSCFGQWEMASDIYIKSSIHIFNSEGGFAEMIPNKPDSENNEHIEFELKELETEKDENGHPILPEELKPKSSLIIKSTFKEIIEGDFMIADHLVIPYSKTDSWYPYSGLQKIWSGETTETNKELLYGIYNEGSDSAKFKCFGESPIAFPPEYQKMSIMEENILGRKFDGENIFRWYGRTEGTIIGIDCDFGKTIKYKRSDRSRGVFNDYEKSIIYPGKSPAPSVETKDFGLSSLDNHIELNKDLISFTSIPKNLYNQFIINDSEIELNGVHICENENEYKEKYTNSKLVFLKDECKFIFNSDIDDLFGDFYKPTKITKKANALLSEIKTAITKKDIDYNQLIEFTDDKIQNTKKGVFVFNNLYCTVKKHGRIWNSEEGWHVDTYRIKVGKSFDVLYKGSTSYGILDLVGAMTLNIKTNNIEIEEYNYETVAHVDVDAFLENLNLVAKKDFKIASLAWYDDYQKVLYARKKKEKFNYVILDRDEWQETQYFQDLIKENSLDEDSSWAVCDEIYDDLCNDPTLLAPEWFYD